MPLNTMLRTTTAVHLGKTEHKLYQATSRLYVKTIVMLINCISRMDEGTFSKHKLI